MRTLCFRRVGLLLAALCASAALPAQSQTLGHAQDSENALTLYGGFLGGGQFTDATTGQDIHVDTKPSFAVALDVSFEPRKQLEVFYTRSRTNLVAGAPISATLFPLAIEYLHFGGTAFFEEIGNGGYAAAGVGATRFIPDSPGLATEVKPSMNIAFGYMIPIVPGLALRFEARAFATLIDSQGGLFCSGSGGCAVSIKGHALYQGEGLIGLTARF